MNYNPKKQLLDRREKYCSDVTQRKYLGNCSNKGPGLKIVNDHKLAQHNKDQIINKKHSSYALIGRIKE